MNVSEKPDCALIDVQEVSELSGTSVNSVYRHVGPKTKMPDFPKPVKFGGATRWRLGEVREYLANLPRARA